MAWKLSNFARLTLSQACEDSDTTIYVSAAHGDLLPTLGVSDKASAIIYGGGYSEIVYVTAESGGTLTVERGQEGTSARDWAAGSALIHTPTAAVLQAVLAATAALIFDGDASLAVNEYTVDVGAGNAIPTLSDGEEVAFLIPTTNPSASPTVVVTNGVDSTLSKSIRHQANSPLDQGDLAADFLAILRFNETDDCWYLISPASNNLHAEKLNSGPVPGVSRHPNGELRAWTAGTTFNNPASGSVTADGWEVEYDGSIGTFSVTRQAFTLGQTDVPGDPQYFLRWNHSAAGSGSTLRRLRVRLPGALWRNGEVVTRRVYLKADASRSVTAKVLQNFGTGGSPSANVEADSDTLNLTTSWQAFTITSTLPSVAGKTLGTAGDDALFLTLDLPLNVTMTIDVATDDFRPGDHGGLVDGLYPIPTTHGGSGRGYPTFAALASALGSAMTAADVPVVDAGGFYSTANVEAVLQEVGTSIAAIGTPVQLKGAWDASSGSFPGAGAAQSGWSYIVSGAGTVDGVAFSVGDRLLAIVNNASAATYAANWLKLDYSDLVTSVAGRTGAVTLTSADLSDGVPNTRTLTAGLGISGGGTLAADRSFAFDPAELTDTTFVLADSIVFLDATDSLPKRRLWSTVISDQALTQHNGDVLFTDTDWRISANTSDGADSSALRLGGGGNATSVTRGAHIALYGNEHASAGQLYLRAGDAGGGIDMSANGTNFLTLTGTVLVVGTIAARTQISSETGGTLTSASANRRVNLASDPTLNSAVFTAGDAGEFYAGASARTITQGSGMTLRLDSTSTTGNRSLPARGRASWYAVSASEIVITGSGVS